MNINMCVIAGRLSKDPELKTTKTGKTCTVLSVAVNHRHKSKDGAQTDEVIFMTSTVWNAEAEMCAKYLKKGSPITIQGRLKAEKWIDKNSGQEREKIVLVCEKLTFMEKMPAVAESGEQSYQAAPQRMYNNPQPQQRPGQSVQRPISAPVQPQEHFEQSAEWEEMPF